MTVLWLDTETTSLEVGDYDQITQIAALAMDPKGFAEGVEAEEVGRFNKKLNLAYGTLDRLAYEEEDAPFRVERKIIYKNRIQTNYAMRRAHWSSRLARKLS